MSILNHLEVDFLVIGAGIVGLNIALQIQKKFNGSRVAVIEKEKEIGLHASGRNSGVLHSGVYYPSDTLKAEFTRKGNQEWRTYCNNKGIEVDNCGKLIVTSNSKDLDQLEILQSRAIANQVEIYLLDEQQTAEIEPCARTFYKSLFIPSTSTANPLLLINSIKNDFLNDGGILLNNCRYIKRLSDTKIKTTKNTIAYKKFINCAGLYADKIAHDFNLGKDYTIIPFKGLYLYGDDNAPKINSHIYPVPNLDNPFLGVHVTRSIEGTTKIGPTAIPAFWRENYSGIDNFSLRDLFEILPLEALLFLRNKNGFRDLAIQEVQKYSRYNLVKDASKLCKNLDAKSFKKWGRSGIRAQLFNIKNKSLEMDFVIDKDDYGIHILNAISPAWTCSMPFAKYIVNMMNG